MMPLLFIAVLGALIATGLFVFALILLIRSHAFQEKLVELARALGLIRADENPIIQGGHSWEGGGVMNPAAVIAGGKTHLFYRAVGDDGVSRIGYAFSDDGTHITERLPYPVFAIQGVPTDTTIEFATHSGLALSGGSWGGAGVEDPRAVVIDGRVYLSFNAFMSWNALRIGVTSISVPDLLAKRWKWSPPVYLSNPAQVHKNWVLFPEKIGGRYAILHGLKKGREEVNIAYIDSLEQDPTPFIESDASFRNEHEEGVWDSKIRGAGPPPLRTKDGWLVLYHANEAKEGHKYKLGALLLDLEHPERIIARSVLPVLAPDAPYENDGKPGIVYACGATIEGDTLRVYYGGGDKVVCMAATSLSKLLKKLKRPGVRP